MNYIDEDLPLDLPIVDSSIIKVIGVGGGGSNAVNHMYKQGITDVSFVVCNTDNQDLEKSPVPKKMQLGKGLGAGGNPDAARIAAEDSIKGIQEMLQDNTKMVFITAGMGGGTGTGASPIVAKTAYELGILTIGIVTIPFAFEGRKKIRQALEGVVALSENVDAILVINNEKLKDIYPDFSLSNAFAKADNVLCNAAKSIAEIITVNGYINTDFADVYSIMKDGNVAIMNTGFASGENRITKAIEDALNSPLLNTNDVSGATKVLLSLYCSQEHEIKMDEVDQIHQFMSKIGDEIDVIWGITYDNDLDDNVKLTLIATGFDVSDIPGMPADVKAKERVMEKKKNAIPFTVNDEPVEQEPKLDKEEIIENAMDEYYKGSVKSDDKKESKIEAAVISLEDLDNEEKREDIENIPAWRRLLNKK